MIINVHPFQKVVEIKSRLAKYLHGIQLKCEIKSDSSLSFCKCNATFRRSRVCTASLLFFLSLTFLLQAYPPVLFSLTQVAAGVFYLLSLYRRRPMAPIRPPSHRSLKLPPRYYGLFHHREDAKAPSYTVGSFAIDRRGPARPSLTRGDVRDNQYCPRPSPGRSAVP